MRILLTLLFLLLISGCSIRPEATDPITHYYLQPDIELSCTPLTGQKVLRLSFMEGTPSLLGQDIIYTKADLKAGKYLYSRWNQSPSHSIMTALYSAFKQNSLFSDIVHENTPVESDITLEIRGLEFKHSFIDNEGSYGIFTLDALIYNSQTHQLIASRLFRSKIRAKSDDAQGGVEALNNALGSVLSELICWSAQKSSAN